MMLQFDDDGTVSKVNEDDLIYVYENEFKELIDEYEQLKKENEVLKEIIKFKCFNEICENCKHGKYWITNDFFGHEGNFECLKGHPADECCEIKECKDYEIEDLNEMLERVKE